MTIVWLILGFIVYTFIGIQVIRFINYYWPTSGDHSSDTVSAVMMWPLVVLLGAILGIGKYINYLVIKD